MARRNAWLVAVVLFTVALSSARALAQEAAKPDAPKDSEPPAWPRVGGHLGFALPIASFNNDGASVIGRDFVQVGITPGITLKLDEHWMIDFEFIGFGVWQIDPDVSRTVVVVDPGVLYDFGPAVVGLRTAVTIGDPMNYALVPIVVLPFKIHPAVRYFIELDLPVGVTAIAGTPAVGGVPGTDSRVLGSFTIQLQTGFGF